MRLLTLVTFFLSVVPSQHLFAEDEWWDYPEMVYRDTESFFVMNSTLHRSFDVQAEINGAAERLQQITGFQVTPYVDFYTRGFTIEGVEVRRGMVAVTFVTDAPKNDDFPYTLFSQSMSLASMVTMNLNFLEQRPFDHLMRYEIPGGGTITEKIMTYVVEPKTRTVEIATQANYLSFVACQGDRPSAEALVAADPDKKVFWSTCQTPASGYGYVIVVHYLDPGI